MKLNLRSQTNRKYAFLNNMSGVLPLAEFGFAPNKGEFRDVLSLRYGRPLKGLPAMCPCGQKYNVTHALNCKKGGFVTMRHNHSRGFEAHILSKIVNDVETEPEVQLTGEIIEGLFGNDSRPVIRIRAVWRASQNTFLDVRVTNTHSPLQIHFTTESVLKKHEQEKK